MFLILLPVKNRIAQHLQINFQIFAWQAWNSLMYKNNFATWNPCEISQAVIQSIPIKPKIPWEPQQIIQRPQQLFREENLRINTHIEDFRRII